SFSVIASRSPEDFRWVQSQSPSEHGLVFQLNLPPESTLVSIESVTSDRVKRTRFNVRPRATLSQLEPDYMGLSDIVMLRGGTSDRPPGSWTLLLSRMATTDTVRKDSRLTLYWESYGALPTDTISVSVTFTRFTPRGLLSVLASRLRLRGDPNS